MATPQKEPQRRLVVTKEERRLAAELKILYDDSILSHKPVEQYPITHLIGDKRKESVVDLAFPELRIVIEVEGPTHLKPEIHDRDCRRHNSIIAKGWTLLRVSDAQIRANPKKAAQYLGHVINSIARNQDC